MFLALIMVNLACWALLLWGLFAIARERDAWPERRLLKRAFRATHRVRTEATALGPLYRRYSLLAVGLLRQLEAAEPRRSRLHALLLANLGRLRAEDLRALRRLEHMVEQLEALAETLARHRVGLSRLGELTVPLRCLDRELARSRGTAA